VRDPHYTSGEGSGSSPVNETDAGDSLKLPLRFLFHSSKTLNNWFKVSPWRRTILYSLVFIALFYLLLEKEKE